MAKSELRKLSDEELVAPRMSRQEWLQVRDCPTRFENNSTEGHSAHVEFDPARDSLRALVERHVQAGHTVPGWEEDEEDEALPPPDGEAPERPFTAYELSALEEEVLQDPDAYDGGSEQRAPVSSESQSENTGPESPETQEADPENEGTESRAAP